MGARGPAPGTGGRPTRPGKRPQKARTLRAAPSMPVGKWSEATRAWWATWASSEQAERFTATAWLRLGMLMPLVELYYEQPSRNLLAEIRLNESKLGGTPEDLARLGWKLDAPKHPANPDNVEILYPDVDVEVE
jgi:hypothetical protein